MSDNRTTELLRKLLEERGIKWRETINHANCIFTWWESPTFGIVHAMDNEDGETLFMACLNNCDFTPEQAIAATLGGGVLTAEQVRETVEKHWHDLPDEYDIPEATALPEYSYDWQAIADELNAELGSEINGETSDGYHTFNELYHHRAVLFSVIVRDHRELAWKARKHHDGTMYEGMFIVGIETPKGQATYHYDLDPYWDMFDCEEREYAPEWDGHTPDDAIVRIAELGSECDKWKAKAEEAGRAMNAAAGLWAKADAENRELRKMLLFDDGTVEEYTERADPLTALAYQKQLAEEWRDRCHNAEALCDKLEAERDELSAELGSGTCEVECFDDGVDEGMDGEWFSYAPPTWYLSCGHTVQGMEGPNFCPSCGARVIKENE